MTRKRHPETWKPKANQPFFFEYWDACGPCRHIQHYEDAKRWLVEKPDDDHRARDKAMTAEFRAIIGPKH